MLPKNSRILYQNIIMRNLNINCQLSDKLAGNARELPGNFPGITREIIGIFRGKSNSPLWSKNLVRQVFSACQ